MLMATPNIVKSGVMDMAKPKVAKAAFLGGPNSNYIILAISLVASVVIGFVVMWFMKLDESLA